MSGKNREDDYNVKNVREVPFGLLSPPSVDSHIDGL